MLNENAKLNYNCKGGEHSGQSKQKRINILKAYLYTSIVFKLRLKEVDC
jgi:hypothetical protein